MHKSIKIINKKILSQDKRGKSSVNTQKFITLSTLKRNELGV
jgi:hypothetical protein